MLARMNQPPSRTLAAAVVAFAALAAACNRDSAHGTTGQGAEAAPDPGSLAVGQPAPTFKATAHDGTAISIADLKGRAVVVYFYPKDETPGCTKQACALRDAWKDLEKSGVMLIGISTDSDESHRAFAKHHELPFHLVSDESGAIARSFGVPNRAGFLARQTFVIGPDGNLKKIYREVDVAKHATDILSDVRS